MTAQPNQFIGHQLKERRIAKHLSMQDLHDLSGLTILRIFEIERTGKAKPEEFEKLNQALGE